MGLIPGEVLAAYGLEENDVSIESIDAGLINQTFLVTKNQSAGEYIIQRINSSVFQRPEIIAENLSRLSSFLQKQSPGLLFPAPIPAMDGALMFVHTGEYWRMLPYVKGTVSLNALFKAEQAYEAARLFGKLTRSLEDFPVDQLKPTITGFHDLSLRYSQFREALGKADKRRVEEAKGMISKAEYYSYINKFYHSYLLRKDFPDRVIHHDTKISNVLLDKNTFTGVCVIDLDTLMPGKFISDLGDMMRTYLCAFSENETDLEKITIRIPYFEALIKGYLSEMKTLLTATEKELILFSGKYIIYMQALRFLTDHLKGNTYYQVDHPLQNLDRSKNQFKLLSEIYDNEKILQDIVDENLTN